MIVQSLETMSLYEADREPSAEWKGKVKPYSLALENAQSKRKVGIRIDSHIGRSSKYPHPYVSVVYAIDQFFKYNQAPQVGSSIPTIISRNNLLLQGLLYVETHPHGHTSDDTCSIHEVAGFCFTGK